MQRPRLGEIGRIRWATFRDNARGYWALIIFLALFGLSLCAELIANDRPLLLMHRGSLYAPILCDYPETTFGGAFETPADYRDPAVRERIETEGWMLWPPIRYGYATVNREIATPFPTPPTRDNILGTDDSGRDVFARLLYGFRLSVLFGLALAAFGSIIGVCVGATFGYYGGWLDIAGQRFMEVWGGLPLTYLLIILASFVEPTFWMLLGIMLLFSWMGLVDIVRAEFLRGRNLCYVQAARALGVTDRVIMFRHILPNAMVATITFLPFILNGSITTLTSLDFLGFGLPPDSPALGELLAQGKANIQAPWIGLSAFAVLGGLLMLLVFIGEAVRDAFDPNRAQAR
ncbi:microcin C transport system permease protein [Desulfobaculum xiamenense]|uniref:Microcin C transport system permease protein n=1 Tax=Desulfobaculum xiamenense TaxID=995050 RepID=A0A846QN60_9BACT|nr:ABC transporter permease [Desulfobaculum xiamenense]NJB67902.1 microcin C transport system permease protein [Desulfobaculum xiamenense]